MRYRVRTSARDLGVLCREARGAVIYKSLEGGFEPSESARLSTLGQRNSGLPIGHKAAESYYRKIYKSAKNITIPSV